MTVEFRRVGIDVADHMIKPRFLDGQELPSWPNGPNLLDYIQQLAKEGWHLTFDEDSSRELIFERQRPLRK